MSWSSIIAALAFIGFWACLAWGLWAWGEAGDFPAFQKFLGR